MKDSTLGEYIYQNKYIYRYMEYTPIMLPY